MHVTDEKELTAECEFSRSASCAAEDDVENQGGRRGMVPSGGRNGLELLLTRPLAAVCLSSRACNELSLRLLTHSYLLLHLLHLVLRFHHHSPLLVHLLRLLLSESRPSFSPQRHPRAKFSRRSRLLPFAYRITSNSRACSYILKRPVLVSERRSRERACSYPRISKSMLLKVGRIARRLFRCI